MELFIDKIQHKKVKRVFVAWGIFFVTLAFITLAGFIESLLWVSKTFEHLFVLIVVSSLVFVVAIAVLAGGYVLLYGGLHRIFRLDANEFSEYQHLFHWKNLSITVHACSGCGNTVRR
jgi:hypothetical protein